jgi:uncharacterized membrane protein YhaH (DUF805 family)
MHWFIDPIKNHYADFTGRATRQEFWMYILFYLLIYICIGIIGGIIKFPQIVFLFSLAVLVPGIAISARRLHDIGKSGWWQILFGIPVIGLIIMIIWLATDSEPGTNKYGPNLKQQEPAATDGGTQPVAADGVEGTPTL